jgi:predicted tellurium resistance membrane protein TerC
LGVNLGATALMIVRAAILFAALACAPVPGFGFFCAAALIFAAWLTARRGEERQSAQPPPTRDLPSMLLAVLRQDAPLALINMLAVQAAAQGHRPLAWLGLALAIPMLALGAAPLVALLRKLPLIWASAILLGWLAGQSAASDSAWALTPMPPEIMRDFAPLTGAVLSLLIVYIYLRRHQFRRLPEQDQ